MNLQTILPEVVLILSVLALIINLAAHHSHRRYVQWKWFNIAAVSVLLLLSVSVTGTLVVSRMDPGALAQFTDSKGWNFFWGIVVMMLLTFIQFRLFQHVLAWIDSRSTLQCDLRLTLYGVFIPLITSLIKMLFTSGYNMFPKNFWNALVYGAGFWEFLSALSMVFAAFLLILQLVQFVVSLRRHLPYLILLLVVYAVVLVSFVFTAVYAAFGLLLLVLLYVVCKIIAACCERDKVVVEIRHRDE